MNSPLTTREARNLQKSLNMRISNEAKSQGRSRDSIRFQLVFESMLRLIFRHPSPGWTLKGGTALLMRNGKGRFTRDMDLARSKRWDSSEELINDLKKLVQGKNGDPFTFEVKEIHSRDNTARGEYATPTATVSIEARLGTLQFHTFKIDVSLSRHTQAPPEHVEVNPLLNTLQQNRLYEPFTVLVTPIEAHLADKICAMRETHHGRTSTRYHDLADIIQIILPQDFSAQKLQSTLLHEARRRNIQLPEVLASPGPEWERGYDKKAKDFYGLPPGLHSLTASLEFAGACLDEILSDQRGTGWWNHRRQQWVDGDQTPSRSS